MTSVMTLSYLDCFHYLFHLCKIKHGSLQVRQKPPGDMQSIMSVVRTSHYGLNGFSGGLRSSLRVSRIENKAIL